MQTTGGACLWSKAPDSFLALRDLEMLIFISHSHAIREGYDTYYPGSNHSVALIQV